MLDAVDWLALGFEIIDCPFADWKFQPPDFVAACGLHAALVVGPPRKIEPGMIAALVDEPPRFAVTLCRDGEQIAEGSGKNSLRSPALVWANWRQRFRACQAPRHYPPARSSVPAPSPSRSQSRQMKRGRPSLKASICPRSHCASLVRDAGERVRGAACSFYRVDRAFEMSPLSLAGTSCSIGVYRSQRFSCLPGQARSRRDAQARDSVM